ncbi:MAG: flagellin lysine-N-methylase, partial [Clostridium sp.]
IEEINYLFLDIIQNYKEVSILKKLFKDSSKFAETVKIKNLSSKWNEYKSLFEEHNKLIENCIVAKILSSCVSDNIEEMSISFEMIMLEYLLVRYAVFLKYCMNKNEKINEEDIKDYIVAFSRIIGNNNDAMIEFFKDGFGKPVLEMGYFCFITLF